MAEPKETPASEETAAKPEAALGKPAVEAAKPAEESAKPTEKTQAQKDQEYIHALHMQLAEERDRRAKLEKALVPELSPEKKAQMTEEQLVKFQADPEGYMRELAQAEAKKMIEANETKALEDKARELGTTSENVKKLSVASSSFKALQTNENAPLMKDESFVKFFSAPETLQKILDPILASTQGKRDDLEVLRDPLVWDLAYARATNMFTEAKGKPAPKPAPTKKDVALASTVQPAPASSAAVVPASALADDEDWKGILAEAKSGLPT